MAETTIQWCDHSWNPWSGCSKVSEGCKNCYAEVDYSVKMRGVKWGPSGNRIVAAESGWKKPLAWNREAGKAPPESSFKRPRRGDRPRVFCASLADVFEDWQGPMTAANGEQLWICPSCGDVGTTTKKEGYQCGNHASFDRNMTRPLTMQDVRNRLFALIDATPNLDWLVLTKRPENIEKMMEPRFKENGEILWEPRPNRFDSPANTQASTKCCQFW